MKLTKKQLQKIIQEEKARILAEMSPGERARGLHLDDAAANRIAGLLRKLYDNAVIDITTEEGVPEAEAEEMAVEGVLEVVKEFLDTIGYRHYMD